MNMSYAEKEFERNKNIKALGLTIAICAALFSLMFLVSWTAPQVPPPVVDDGIEVNLGNADVGMGTKAPEIPGEMSKADETNYQPPKVAASRAEPDEVKDVAENNERHVPEIHTSPKPKKEPKPVAELPKAKAEKNR